jgi:hypothetical protein
MRSLSLHASVQIVFKFMYCRYKPVVDSPSKQQTCYATYNLKILVDKVHNQWRYYTAQGHEVILSSASFYIHHVEFVFNFFFQ